MKKILFVTHSFGIGGVETALTNLANELYKKGYDITIAVTSDNLTGADNLLPGIKLKHKDEPQFKLFKKIPYVRNFYESGMWSRRKSPQKLYKFFVGADEKYDVEIAFFFGRPLKAVYGSLNRKAKKILFIHSDYKQTGEGVFMGFYDKESAKIAYNFFDKVICVSNGVKRSFKETIGREKDVEVIYNINDCKKIKNLALEKTDMEHKRFTFVCVSRLSAEKGIIRVLESAEKLNREGFSFDVWIVGDGADRAALIDYADKNALENVTFLGNKDNPYPYIANADILVCSSSAEAYGLSVAESFILEKPVIVTDCVGPRELVGNGEYGILVENSSEGVYIGMKKVLTDKNCFEHYCKKAAERSDFFDSDKLINDIERVINE